MILPCHDSVSRRPVELREKFQALTQAEEAAGLYEDTATIGFLPWLHFSRTDSSIRLPAAGASLKSPPIAAGSR